MERPRYTHGQYSSYNPSTGPKYAPNGDCICPLCGKGYRKLGSHLTLSHELSASAYKKWGWNVRKNIHPSNAEFRAHMKKIQDPKTISENLIAKGSCTRFGQDGGNTMAVNRAVVKHRCLKCKFVKDESFCNKFNKQCKFVTHCKPEM